MLNMIKTLLALVATHIVGRKLVLFCFKLLAKQRTGWNTTREMAVILLACFFELAKQRTGILENS